MKIIQNENVAFNAEGLRRLAREINEGVRRLELSLGGGKNAGAVNGGTKYHNELVNRELANQHPISAVNGLAAALAALDGELTAEFVRIDALDTRIAALDARLDTLENDVETEAENLDDAELDIAALQAAAAALEARVEALEIVAGN